MIIKCPECGHQVSDQAKICPSCGIEIAGKVTQCPDCGEIIFKEQAECPNCHRSINGASDGYMSSRAAASAEALAELDRSEARNQPAPRRPRKHRTAVTVFIVAFVLALIVVLLGIYFMKNQEQQNEMRAYENSIKSSEPLVLQNFLDMYTDAPIEHRDSIRALLETLRKVEADWSDALVSNSRYAYERFLKLHPQSIHTVEADIKVDSLDWVAAVRESTVEAFQEYLTKHHDGAYYDEARASMEKMEAQQLKPEDRQMAIQILTTFFNALAQMDEAALSASVAPVMTSFLHRQNATKDDVILYMHKMHEADVTKIEFSLNNDWNIEKVFLDEDRYVLKASFSVAQHMERTDESRESNAVYKISAQVTPDGRISELNMKRSVQPSSTAE